MIIILKRIIVACALLTLLCFCARCAKPETGKTYYVDNESGDDVNRGLSATTAWKTLANINAVDLNPGDRVLLKGGQEHVGTLRFDKSDAGSAEHPVIISSYGDGKATISNVNNVGIRADSSAFLILAHLDIKGSGRTTNVFSGIRINACQSVHIDSVRVHGFQKSGIDIVDSPDVKVTRVHAFDNGFAGISAQSWEKLNKNLYIGYCLAENNPGDPTNLDNHSGNGIVVSGVDVGLIEYCAATNNGWDMPREGNGPVGIWVWHSNRVIIQHCIAFQNKTSERGKDGGGFDFDGGVTNSILQYNLSYNNEGAGFGLYQYAGAEEWSNNIIRYNISFNDGWKNGQCGIHVWASPGDEATMHTASIYNNTIVNESGHAVAFLLDAPVADFYFANNIFYSQAEHVYGLYAGNHFENNLYWSPTEPHFSLDGIKSLELWARETNQEWNEKGLAGLNQDPLLNVPDSLQFMQPASLREVTFFKTATQSPARSRGIRLQNHASYDFWSHPIPASAPDIGAFQH